MLASSKPHMTTVGLNPTALESVGKPHFNVSPVLIHHKSTIGLTTLVKTTDPVVTKP